MLLARGLSFVLRLLGLTKRGKAGKMKQSIFGSDQEIPDGFFFYFRKITCYNNHMKSKVIEFNQEQRQSKKLPDLQAGDVVKVHLRIKEGGKERIQVFKGIIISMKGKQSSSPTITVRKVSNGIGVEMIIPILSKNVEKIEMVKRAKVRRAKLYYVRGLTAKQSRMKYKDVSEFIAEEKEETPEEEKTVPEAEAPKKEETPIEAKKTEKKETSKEVKEDKEEATATEKK